MDLPTGHSQEAVDEFFAELEKTANAKRIEYMLARIPTDLLPYARERLGLAPNYGTTDVPVPTAAPMPTPHPSSR